MVRRGGKGGEFDAAFDLHAEGVQKFFEQALGFILRNHQRERIGRSGIVEIEVGDLFFAGKNIRAKRMHAGRQKLVDDPHATDEFEGARPDDQGFGFVVALWNFFDDANRQAVAGEFGGEGQAHGAGAGD